MRGRPSGEVCDGCGFPGPVGGLRDTLAARKPGGEPYRFCPLCFYSGAGVVLTRPAEQNPALPDLVRIVCYVANMVRKDIKDCYHLP